MGAFQDRTSMDRILFAAVNHENKSQGVSSVSYRLKPFDVTFAAVGQSAGPRPKSWNFFGELGTRPTRESS